MALALPCLLLVDLSNAHLHHILNVILSLSYFIMIVVDILIPTVLVPISLAGIAIFIQQIKSRNSKQNVSVCFINVVLFTPKLFYKVHLN